MMRMRKISCSLLLLLLAGVFWAGEAHAASNSAKIHKLDVSTIDTPSFKPEKHASSSSVKWCIIEVEYTVEGDKNEWNDNVELRWFVAFAGSSSQKHPLMTRSVFYRDINGGRRHHACVLLPQRFFERYAAPRYTLDRAPISVYVELRVDGKRVATKEHRGSGIPSGEWWKDNNNKMRKLEGNLLLPRYMTPFSVVDTHYFDPEERETR